MKSTLPEFYSPTEEDLKSLWATATFVFDTNVLLNLYRLPQDALKDFFAALESVKERSWIPFHVALEFQLNRTRVIAAEHKATNENLEKAKDCLSKASDILRELELEKRGLGLNPDEIEQALDNARQKLIAAIQATHEGQIPVGTSDDVRTRLDQIFDEERVGVEPGSQTEIDAIQKEGCERYERRIPPGFEDGNKSKNPNDSAFSARGIVYERQYGDLILWKQLLSHVRAKEIESVIFVTADNKSDWWSRESGKTLGPQPALSAEMRKLGGARNFWMYSATQFLQLYDSQSGANISQSSIDEVKSVAEEASGTDNATQQFLNISVDGFAYHDAIVTLKNWLRLVTRGKVESSDLFPDFWVYQDGKRIAVELALFKHFRPSSLQLVRLREHFDRSRRLSGEEISAFVGIVVITQRAYFEWMASENYQPFREELERLRVDTQINTLVIGTLGADEFVPSIVLGQPFSY